MIYIDCGFYVGKALESYKEKGLLNDAWIYAFEASPELEVPDFVRPEAVWIDDKGVDFQIGGRNDASSIKGTSGHGEPRLVEVPSIDFSKFVADLPDEYIICNMDIEGAEFTVLRKMLDEGTIDKIDLLDIEFHHRLMLDKTPQDSQELINEIITRGVALRLKVPLS